MKATVCKLSKVKQPQSFNLCEGVKAKRLTYLEVKAFAEKLKFTIAEANEITNIFFFNKTYQNRLMETTDLTSLADYIREYECSWYRYDTWDKLLQSEKEQGSEGLSEQDCKKELGVTIYRLKSGKYIQTVY